MKYLKNTKNYSLGILVGFDITINQIIQKFLDEISCAGISRERFLIPVTCFPTSLVY